MNQQLRREKEKFYRTKTNIRIIEIKYIQQHILSTYIWEDKCNNWKIVAFQIKTTINEIRETKLINDFMTLTFRRIEENVVTRYNVDKTFTLFCFQLFSATTPQITHIICFRFDAKSTKRIILEQCMRKERHTKKYTFKLTHRLFRAYVQHHQKHLKFGILVPILNKISNRFRPSSKWHEEF